MNGGLYIVCELPPRMRIQMVEVLYARMKGACCLYMWTMYTHMNGE